jgi:hypothetical protein
MLCSWEQVDERQPGCTREINQQQDFQGLRSEIQGTASMIADCFSITCCGGMRSSEARGFDVIANALG